MAQSHSSNPSFEFRWKDRKWMQERENGAPKPCSVYRVHPEFWRRKWDENHRPLFMAELEKDLVGYASDLGFHYIEFCNPPHALQWDAQTPDLRPLIDELHRHKLGFILSDPHITNDVASALHTDGMHDKEFVRVGERSVPLSSYLLDAVLEEMEMGTLSDLLFPAEADPDTNQWIHFARIRLALTLLYAFPGATLLSMGQEWGCQLPEHLEQIPPWSWLDHAPFAANQRLVTTLNNLQNKESALHEPAPSALFEWIIPPSKGSSTLAFFRKSAAEKESLLVIANWGIQNHDAFELGIPEPRAWRELINSDDSAFWGSGFGNTKPLQPIPIPKHGQSHQINLRLPGMSCIILKPQGLK